MLYFHVFTLLQSIANVMNDAAFFTRMGLNLLIRQTNSQPLVKMTAKEFMFGYKSTLLSLGNKFMPSWISFDKLGLIDRVSSLCIMQIKIIFLEEGNETFSGWCGVDF